MGKIDIATKSYMSANTRFADIFNFCLYGGKEVLKAEDLVEKDPTELFLTEQENEKTLLQKNERDLLKEAVVREADGIYYMLLGLENQSFIDYGMPVRGMMYESMRYTKQVQELKKIQEEAYKQGEISLTSDEFLSGISKKDKLFPVITLTLYWGTREWDGPKSLHEMLDVKDDNLWHCISDYRVNLILPQEIEDFSVFKTDLKQVLETIKVSKDKQKMKELFEGDEAFKSLDREAAMIIKNYTGLEYKFDESEEQWDMCQGLIDIKAEEREEGREEGRKEGRIEILSSMISNMYEQGLSVEDIAKYTKLDLTEVKGILGV